MPTLRLRLGLLVVLGGLAVPAVASAASCPQLPTTQAFAKYGDAAQYSLAPGGDFEAGGPAWQLTNAKLVAGNGGTVSPGSRSVALGTGWWSGPAGLVSPWFCVNAEHPYFRYMLKPNGPVGLLATFIRYKANDGSLVQQQVTSKVSTNLGPGAWKASDLNPLSIKIPLGPGGTAKVQLVFVSPMSTLGVGYFVDSVMIDPYRRG